MEFGRPMTLSAQPRPTSAGTKIMLAMVIVLSVVLTAMSYAAWREKNRGAVPDFSPATAADASVVNTAVYTFNLAKLVEQRCGTTKTTALEAASEHELEADPELKQRAVAEAAARAAMITSYKSCDYVVSEINAAEFRTMRSKH